MWNINRERSRTAETLWESFDQMSYKEINMKKFYIAFKENMVVVSLIVYALAIVFMQYPYIRYFGFIPYNPWLYIIIGSVNIILILSVYGVGYLLYKKMSVNIKLKTYLLNNVSKVTTFLCILLISGYAYIALAEKGHTVLNIMFLLVIYSLINILFYYMIDSINILVVERKEIEKMFHEVEDDFVRLDQDFKILFEQCEMNQDEINIVEFDKFLKKFLECVLVKNDSLFSKPLDIKIKFVRMILDSLTEDKIDRETLIEKLPIYNKVDKIRTTFTRIKKTQKQLKKDLILPIVLILVLVVQFTGVIMNELVVRNAQLLLKDGETRVVEVITVNDDLIYCHENEKYYILTTNKVEEIVYYEHKLKLY
jgi:hypothetical protein